MQCAETESLKREQKELVAKFEQVKAELCKRLEQANQEVNGNQLFSSKKIPEYSQYKQMQFKLLLISGVTTKSNTE